MNDKLKKQIENKLREPGFQEHRYPGTRRDLLKLGLLAGGGTLFPLGGIGEALAQAASRVMIPYLVFDCAGGAALPGNFLVGKQGGPEDLCSDYSKLGWDPRKANALDKTFGIPMSRMQSKILAGIKETAPSAVNSESQKIVKMASLCHFSLDDNSTNRASALGMVASAGLQGFYLKGGLGQVASYSGGNSDDVLKNSRFRPKAVTNINQILELTSFGDDFAALDSKTRNAIFQRLQDLSGNSAELRNIYADLSKFGVIQPKMDPRNVDEIVKLYKLEGPKDTSTKAVEAAIVYNVLQGYSGPGAITLGGCDYHDNTQTTGDDKDLEIGRIIGRAISAAYSLKKPFMFHIVTDGGIYSKPNERVWVGDEAQHSLGIIGYVNPSSSVELRKMQVGHYSPNGLVDQRTVIGGGPDKAALAIIANYLHLNGMLDQFEQVAQSRLQPKEIDELLVFA